MKRIGSCVGISVVQLVYLIVEENKIHTISVAFSNKAEIRTQDPKPSLTVLAIPKLDGNVGICLLAFCSYRSLLGTLSPSAC